MTDSLTYLYAPSQGGLDRTGSFVQAGGSSNANRPLALDADGMVPASAISGLFNNDNTTRITQTYVTSVAVTMGQIVGLDGTSGQLVLVTNTTDSNFVGVVAADALLGEMATVITSGVATLPTGVTFPINSEVILGISGAPVVRTGLSTMRTNGVVYVVPIGQSDTSMTYLIKRGTTLQIQDAV